MRDLVIVVHLASPHRAQKLHELHVSARRVKKTTHVSASMIQTARQRLRKWE